MTTSILFGILMTLLSHKQVTAKFLSEKFEVSVRTIMRYIDALSVAGIPVYSTQGISGGFSISSEFQIDKAFFSEGELERLRSLVKNSDDDKINRSISDKLEYINKRKADERYLFGNDSLIIDAGPWGNPTAYRAKMETLQKAINDGKSVKLSYIDRYESHTYRVFDPYYRVLKEGVWYTFGWCHSRKDFRLFKLARIDSIIETQLPFTKKDCNVYEHLDAGFDDGALVDIEFEFSSTVLADIEDWLGHDAVFERGVKYIAHATVLGGKQLLAKLLSFGSSIKMLSPQSLCDEIVAECKRILKR